MFHNMWPTCFRFLFPCLWFWLIGLSLSQAQVLNWQYDDILTDAQEPGLYPTLAIDIQGNSHFTVWDEELDILFYAFRNKRTGQFTFERIPDTGTFGYRSAIKIARNGDIHIGYLHNDNGLSTLRHAIKSPAGIWTIENATPPGVPNIGVYGPDIQYPTYIQPWVDVFFSPQDKPAISYFDGRILAIISCSAAEPNGFGNSYAGYELDLKFTVRDNSAWNEQKLPEITYVGNVPCLPNGDRFGEYAKMEQTSDGRYIAVTPSRHNHQLLVMISAPNDLDTWVVHAVDSIERILSIGVNHFWESFGFLDTELTGDSILHVSYTLSNKYGVTSVFADRQTAFYLKVNLDSLGMTGYTPVHHHVSPTAFSGYQTGLMTFGPDTVVEAVFVENDQQLYTLSTTDGGTNWEQKAVASLSSSGPIGAGVFEDSLYIYGFDNLKGRLLELSRHRHDTSWITRFVTRNQVRGFHLSAAVNRTASDDIVHIAFTEGEQDQLLYGIRQNSQWQFESIDTIGQEFGEVALLLDDQQQPVVVFISEHEHALKFARKRGSSWETFTVVDTLTPLELAFARHEDQYHLFLFDGLGRNLTHAAGNPEQGWVLEVVDSTSLITGQEPRAAATADGTIHVSYQDVLGGMYRYASRSPGGSWVFDSLGMPGQFPPSTHDLAIRSDGQPVLAFREGFSDSLYLGTRMAPGNWDIQNIDGDINNLSGNPIKLILSQNDRPWVLYNYETVITELRLIRKDEQGRWQRVSVINNGAQIGRSIDFELVDEDFYIIGKKNQSGNNGLGLLFAPEGINTNLDAGPFAAQWEVFPNPAHQHLSMRLSANLSPISSPQLYNAQGQVWHLDPYQIDTDTWQCDLSSLMPGLYVLTWQTETGTLNQKIMIQPE